MDPSQGDFNKDILIHFITCIIKFIKKGIFRNQGYKRIYKTSTCNITVVMFHKIL